MNVTELCLNVDIRKSKIKLSWLGAIEAPTLDKKNILILDEFYWK